MPVAICAICDSRCTPRLTRCCCAFWSWTPAATWCSLRAPTERGTMRWCVMGRGRVAVLLWPPLTRRGSVQVSRLVAAAAVRYSSEGTPGLSQQALSVVSRLLLVPQQRHPDFLTLLAFADSIVDTHPFGEAWVVANCVLEHTVLTCITPARVFNAAQVGAPRPMRRSRSGRPSCPGPAPPYVGGSPKHC